jgi:hypothetical protein
MAVTSKKIKLTSIIFAALSPLPGLGRKFSSLIMTASPSGGEISRMKMNKMD